MREREEGLMARPRTGTLRRQATAQGVSFGVQFRYRGATHYVYLGGSWDGWDDARAEHERQFLMEKVNRGEWTPPRPGPAAAPATAVPMFQLFASEWLYRTRQTLADPEGKTARDLEWRLSVVMDKFGPVAVDRIDGRSPRTSWPICGPSGGRSSTLGSRGGR
jgi:hypothetical protein